MRAGPARASLVLVPLTLLLAAAACGGPGEPAGDWMPGDSLESLPAGEPVAGGETPGCPVDSLDPGRLDLTAAWEEGHVRVSGRVRGGAAKTLNARLAHGDRFVYDEVFRGERGVGALSLASDSVYLLSEAYAPTPGELEALRRVGAGPREVARPLCLDLALYEPGTLDRLAARQIPLPDAP